MLHYPIETLNKLIKEAKEAIYHELCLRLQLSRSWFIPPPEPKYGLGSRSPIGKSYNVFSGLDTRVVFSDENGDQRLATVQCVSFDKDCTSGCGTMSVLLFDKDPVEELLGKTGRLYVFAAAEDSEPWSYFDEEVKFTNFRSKVSIDDLCLEGTYDFKILSKDKE